MSHQLHDVCDHCSHHHELEVNGLVVDYRKTRAVDDVSLATSCGNAVAFVGPNGAGKSTLLKSIAGLLKPSRGEILWRGTKVSRWSREIAYLPQREQIDWSFPITVRGVVEMGRYPQTGWWKSFQKNDDDVIARALAEMQLEDLADRQISELSGGQQQRVAVARAAYQGKSILLGDEPFSAVDADQADAILTMLKQQHSTLVLALHDVPLALRHCSRVIGLVNGNVVIDQPTERVSTTELQKLYDDESNTVKKSLAA